MASSLANDYLEVVEIVVYDWHDRRNENVVKSEDESDHKEQEMEVDTGGGEQGSERVQQSSEENNVPDVPEAHVTPWRRDAVTPAVARNVQVLGASVVNSLEDC